MSGNHVAIGDFANKISLFDLRKPSSSLFEFNLEYEADRGVYVRFMF